VSGLITIGTVVRPQGRVGEVRVLPLTDDPRRFAELRGCYLIPPDQGEYRAIEGCRFQGRMPVVKLEGCDSIAAAEGVVGRLLGIPLAECRSLPPGRFYAFELVGCEVLTPEGARLGRIDDVWESPAHDLWVVRGAGREVLVPAVSAIVESVDLAARRVVVRPPEGLLQL